MKKLTKDIGRFGLGSIVLGGGAAVVGKAYGGTYAGGLSAMGGLMPAVGTLVVTKHIVRLGGSAMKALPKQIRPSKKAKRIFG